MLLSSVIETKCVIINNIYKYSMCTLKIIELNLSKKAVFDFVKHFNDKIDIVRQIGFTRTYWYQKMV